MSVLPVSAVASVLVSTVCDLVVPCHQVSHLHVRQTLSRSSQCSQSLSASSSSCRPRALGCRSPATHIHTHTHTGLCKQVLDGRAAKLVRTTDRCTCFSQQNSVDIDAEQCHGCCVASRPIGVSERTGTMCTDLFRTIHI